MRKEAFLLYRLPVLCKIRVIRTQILFNSVYLVGKWLALKSYSFSEINHLEVSISETMLLIGIFRYH